MRSATRTSQAAIPQGSATRTSQAAIPQGSATRTSQAAIPQGSATRTSQAAIPQGSATMTSQAAIPQGSTTDMRGDNNGGDGRRGMTTEGKYYCTFCSKEAGDFKPRFRLTVRVEDSTAQTTFTLFNKEAEQIVGIPVDKIIDELPEGTNIAEIPPVIGNIIGKRCVFDVKINEYNTVRGYEDYTVFRLKLSHQTEHASTSNKDNTDSSKKQRVN
ncbi:hypothetical protein ACET3Z_009566 [Daucus carota]